MRHRSEFFLHFGKGPIGCLLMNILGHQQSYYFIASLHKTNSCSCLENRFIMKKNNPRKRTKSLNPEPIIRHQQVPSPILPIVLMVSSPSRSLSPPSAPALLFLNLKLLKGDLDRVMDFPLFFSEAVLERRDNIANTNTVTNDTMVVMTATN